MFISKQNETPQHHAWANMVADVPNGGTLSVSELTQKTLAEGTPVGKGEDGLWHVIKTASVSATASSDATTYVVAKGHNLKVGDVVMLKTNSKAYAITAIATNADNTANDDITLGTTLGAAKAGDVLVLASKAGASGSAPFIKPVGLTAYSIDVVPNATIGIGLIGTIHADKIQPLGDLESVFSTIKFI